MHAHRSMRHDVMECDKDKAKAAYLYFEHWGSTIRFLIKRL